MAAGHSLLCSWRRLDTLWGVGGAKLGDMVHAPEARAGHSGDVPRKPAPRMPVPVTWATRPGCQRPGCHRPRRQRRSPGPRAPDASPAPASHLALPPAPVAPPHQALVILILLGQVVIEDALGHRLREEGERGARGCAAAGRPGRGAARGPRFKPRLPQGLPQDPAAWPRGAVLSQDGDTEPYTSALLGRPRTVTHVVKC